MEELDLEVAADYIYMAALLIHIKSKMLLPRDEERKRKRIRERARGPSARVPAFRSVAETFAELDVLRMGVWSRPRAGAGTRSDGDRHERGLALRSHRRVPLRC